jgi:hypothetical protein
MEIWSMKTRQLRFFMENPETGTSMAGQYQCKDVVINKPVNPVRSTLNAFVSGD